MSVNLPHNENLDHFPPYPQSKKSYDRFIPNRALMQKNHAVAAYWVDPPCKPDEQALFRAIFPGRTPYMPTLELSSREVTEIKKEYRENSLKYEGNCSVHITHPCEWVGETLTIATTNCVYNTHMTDSLRTTYCTMEDHDEVYAFAWNPSETHLAVAYNQNALMIWNRNVDDSYELRKSTKSGRTSQVQWINSDLIAMGYNLEFALIDQRSNKTALQHYNFGDFYSGFLCSKDGNQIYLNTSGGAVKTFDIRNNKFLSTQKIAHNTITHLNYLDPSEKQMVATSKDGFLRIFDVVGEKFKLAKQINTKIAITSLARLKDYWVLGHQNQTASYWNAQNLEKFGEKQLPGLRYVFTDPAKKSLGVLLSRPNQEVVEIYKV